MLFRLFRQQPRPAYVKPVPPFPYCVRDNRTGQIIAHGSEAKCLAYIAAFGECHLDTVS